MSPWNIIRAWKDPEYRLSLSEAERALLPAHPAGLIELTDTELDAAAGGLQPAPKPKTKASSLCTECLPRRTVERTNCQRCPTKSC